MRRLILPLGILMWSCASLSMGTGPSTSAMREWQWVPEGANIAMILDPAIVTGPVMQKRVWSHFATKPGKEFPDLSEFEKNLGFSLKDVDRITVAMTLNPSVRDPQPVVVARFKTPGVEWFEKLKSILHLEAKKSGNDTYWEGKGDLAVVQKAPYLILTTPRLVEAVLAKKTAQPWVATALAPYEDQMVAFAVQIPKNVKDSWPKTFQSLDSVTFSFQAGDSFVGQSRIDAGNPELAQSARQMLEGLNTFFRGAARLALLAIENGDLKRDQGQFLGLFTEMAKLLKEDRSTVRYEVQGNILAIRSEVPADQVEMYAKSLGELFAGEGSEIRLHRLLDLLDDVGRAFKPKQPEVPPLEEAPVPPDEEDFPMPDLEGEKFSPEF